LVVGLSEHLAHVESVRLSELACRLSGFVRVEDCLHRIRDVAGVFRGDDICLRTVLVYRANDLRHFNFNRLFRVFDFFNLLVAFLRHVRQRVLKVDHAVVSCAVGALFCAVFVGHFVGLLFAVPEGVTEIICSKTLLLSKRACLGIPQYVREMRIRGLDLSTIKFSVR
jgi:hypothetical protein